VYILSETQNSETRKGRINNHNKTDNITSKTSKRDRTETCLVTTHGTSWFWRFWFAFKL